jgi:hypothetical protein
MDPVTYETRVRRRRGRWHVSVPALPRDAPVLKLRKLDNAPALLIEQIAAYVGTSVNAVSVTVRPPKRVPRKVRPVAWQVAGGLGALGGVYLLAGLAVTLLIAGAAIVTLGALKESGRI